MFYFFFESRNRKNDPVVIWLTGGPGCSSELALFYENGPFHLAKNLSLVWNDYGWDKVYLIRIKSLLLSLICSEPTFYRPLAGIKHSVCRSAHWNWFQLYFRWWWHSSWRKRCQQRFIWLLAGLFLTYMFLSTSRSIRIKHLAQKSVNYICVLYTCRNFSRGILSMLRMTFT